MTLVDNYAALGTRITFTGGRLMALSSHLEELHKKHSNLSSKVEQAQRSLGIDDLDVQKLKKQKMAIKEEIARLTPA